jgi:lysozyme
MKPSQNCILIVKQFEGYFSHSYLCPASVWTIGFGSITWMDGQPVKQNQTIDMAGAEKLLMWELTKKSRFLDDMKLNINQNQFDSLCSLIYNIGEGNFSKSTLLKKIKKNPGDITIRDEFMKWNKARVNGTLTALKGLTRRRNLEANLYFKQWTSIIVG